jgi:hypothetical protein
LAWTSDAITYSTKNSGAAAKGPLWIGLAGEERVGLVESLKVVEEACGRCGEAV